MAGADKVTGNKSDPLRTPLATRFDLQVPLFQAPTGLETSELVAAVCNAGGFGMHALSWNPAAELPAMIRKTKSLTQRPFGGNLVIAWDQHERLEVALAEGLKVISFFWGDPRPYADKVHQAGGLVMCTVGSVDAARRAMDSGTDILVAQGIEAGGHVIGEVSTMVLVPAIRAAFPDVPIVAAGGIANGRGLAAVLCLGADAAWCGTRFVATQESSAHPAYKAAIIAAAETETIHSKVFDGGWPDAPHRALVNSTVRAWRSAGSPPPGSRPGEGEIVAVLKNGTQIPRYHEYPPDAALAEGDPEVLCQYAGQSAGLVHSLISANQVVLDMASEARRILNR